MNQEVYLYLVHCDKKLSGDIRGHSEATPKYEIEGYKTMPIEFHVQCPSEEQNHHQQWKMWVNEHMCERVGM